MDLATVSSSLAPLALLACPVGMGVMMWMMMRGTKSRSERPGGEPPATQAPSVEVLREEQRRLSAEIDRLEHEGLDTTDNPEVARS